MTTEDFIARAKQIHGDTYDYSKVKYKNSVSKVEIICREHGSFPYIWTVAERSVPGLIVLSQAEIEQSVEIQILGVVKI